jgi:hypothetical protein
MSQADLLSIVKSGKAFCWAAAGESQSAAPAQSTPVRAPAKGNLNIAFPV